MGEREAHSRKPITRRAFLRWTGMVAAAGTVAACGGGKPESTTQPVTKVPTTEATSIPPTISETASPAESTPIPEVPLTAEQLKELLRGSCEEIGDQDQLVQLAQYPFGQALENNNLAALIDGQMQTTLIAGEAPFTESGLTQEQLAEATRQYFNLKLQFLGDQIISFQQVAPLPDGSTITYQRMIVLDTKKQPNDPSRIGCASSIITPEGENYIAWRTRRTKSDGGPDMATYVYVDKSGQVKRVELPVGIGGVGATPTPETQVTTEVSPAEKAQIAEVLGENDLTILRLQGQGSLGAIDFISGSNAEGVRGKVNGFEIPSGWKKEDGDPKVLIQQTLLNIIFARWKISNPGVDLDRKKFADMVLRGELSETTFEYLLPDGQNGLKQFEVDLTKGVGLVITDYKTFKSNSAKGQKGELYVTTNNRTKGIAIIVSDNKLYLEIATDPAGLSKGTYDQYEETYAFLERMAIIGIYSGLEQFDGFVQNIGDGTNIVNKWMEFTNIKGLDAARMTYQLLAPLYEVDSTGSEPIPFLMKMEIPFSK